MSPVTQSDLPKPPASLGTAGKKLWATIQGDLSEEWELDARDLDTLAEACAVQDTIAALDTAIKRDGEVLEGERGPRVNPAVVEVRQARVAKMRLLASVDLDERLVSTPAQRRAQNAATVRWDLERKKRGGRHRAA